VAKVVVAEQARSAFERLSEFIARSDLDRAVVVVQTIEDAVTSYVPD
jgi:hypothetical protein